MHLKVDFLRAFLDGELAPGDKKTAAEHLAGCSKCTARLLELEGTAARATRRLQILAPQPQELKRSPHSALQTIDRRKENSMNNIFRRPAWAIAGLVTILAVALMFPPVRALAGSFLGLFRVQQVQVISFDPVSLERFNNSETSDMLQAFFNQNLTTTKHGEYAQVDSIEAAASLAGFNPRLPARTEVTSLSVQPGETVEINIVSEMMNAGLESYGFSDVKIPADLDGQKIVATIPASVISTFGECPTEAEENPETSQLAACIGLVQLPAPSVTAPDSFPVVQLGEVVLQLIGMSPEQAAEYSQSVDWSSTLILPIPTGSNVETRETYIDGVSGTFIREGENNQYALVWVKDGVLYGLTGSGDSGPAFRLAETLE